MSDEDDEIVAHDATGAVVGYLSMQRRRNDSTGSHDLAHEIGEESEEHELSGTDDDGVVVISPAFACFTLIMSVVGTGLLALPSVFRCLGVLQGLVTLVFVSIFMYFTGSLMVRCHLSGVGERELDTYESLAEQSCLKRGFHEKVDRAKFIVNIVNAIGLFGGCCAYISIAKDILPRMKQRYSNLDHWYEDEDFVTAVLVLCISLPLCLKRKLHSLRYSSTLGFVFSIYMIFVIAIRGFEKIVQGTAKWGEFGARKCSDENIFISFVIGLSIFNFSFVFHFNVIPLFKSLPKAQRKDTGTMHKILLYTVLCCALLYGSVGVTGFALFGEDVDPNILNNFDPDDEIINTARFAIIACCFLCLPLLMHPLRATTLSLCNRPSTKVSRLWVTVTLLSVQYLIALVAPSIKTVFSFTGGGAVVGFCYVFPFCFALALLGRRKCTQEESLLTSSLKPELLLSKLETTIIYLSLVFFPIAGIISIITSIIMDS